VSSCNVVCDDVSDCYVASFLMTIGSYTFLRHNKSSKPKILLFCLQHRILLDIMAVARSVPLMYTMNRILCSGMEATNINQEIQES